MAIQRVLHLNQNVSLHHRLSSSPFLFMFFFFFFFLFFWDSCKRRFLPFRSKKEKEREELFFAFLVLPLFSRPFRRFERDKKRELSFFSSTIWREQTNERECVAEIEKYDRRKSPKRRRSIEEGTFPFLLCRFVFVFDQDVVSFREEREKREPPKKPKRKEKILSVQKIRVPLLLLSVPKTSRQRTTKGLQNKFWIVSKTFISLNYNNWAIQIPISVINLNTRTHTYI